MTETQTGSETALEPAIITEASTWKNAMKLAIRDSKTLMDALGLEPADIAATGLAERQFPVFVPLEFLGRMRPKDPTDPLLLQVLAQDTETYVAQSFHQDPVGDSLVEVAPGLLHKYRGRVLMIVSGACAVHCRYCFRRHYPYNTAPKRFEDWLPSLDYIRNDSTIHEVILSGGDPLTVTDDRLAELLEHLDAISHLARLRIHTRLPVVIPQRVDDALCRWLSATRLSKWVVLHINHVHEIDGGVVDAIRRLQSCGAIVLNQAVLLRDINDSVETLAELCERLVNLGVLPYYLHQLDRVAGAQHFEVDESQGLHLVSELAKRLPGFAVPKYVVEISGEASKSPILPEHRLAFLE
jgi:EF-P beta-lysylation protein EpmB